MNEKVENKIKTKPTEKSWNSTLKRLELFSISYCLWFILNKVLKCFSSDCKTKKQIIITGFFVHEKLLWTQGFTYWPNYRLLEEHWSAWPGAPGKQYSETYGAHDIGLSCWCTWLGQEPRAPDLGEKGRDSEDVSWAGELVVRSSLLPLARYPCNAG